MNELYLIKSGDNGFVEETSAVISADSGEISINDSLYVESAGNIGIGSSNPANKLDVVGSASISSDLTVNGITFSNVGGNSPSAVNDIIKYDGNNWVVAASTTLPGGGGGGAGNSDVPAGLINTLTQGETIHEVDFGYDSNNDRIVYDNVPKIAASLEIDGAGEIIPHTVSGVSESGYFVVFSEELPTANYRMHTVFGGTDAFWETGVANLEYSERSVEIDRSLYVGQKVGIGTTNPGTKLQVVETSGGTQFEVRGTAATGGQFQINNAGGDIYANFRGAGSNDDVAKINTNGNSFFNGGNVGIGTTNPGAKLEVDYTSASQVGLTLNGSNSALNNAIKLTDASDNAITLSINAGKFGINGGNVGIGTTDPASVLEAQGKQGYADSANNLLTSTTKSALRVRGSNNSSDSLWMGVETVNANPYMQGSNGSGSNAKNILINPFGGNVGIGTTNPNTSLEVTGAAGSQFRISRDIAPQSQYSEISGGGSTMKFKSVSDTHSSFMFVSDDGNGEVERMRINASGNVGIGTVNPTAPLTVTEVSNVAFRMLKSSGSSLLSIGEDGGTSVIFSGESSGGGLIFKTTDSSGTNECMRITSTGNVGIGTASPGSLLHLENQSFGDLLTLRTLDGTNNPRLFIGTSSTGVYFRNSHSTSAGDLDFQNGLGGSKVMIKENGNVGIGTTNPSAGRLDVWQAETSNDATIKSVRPGAADRRHIAFYNANGIVGDIRTSGNTTSYNTSSDYRLKENVVKVDDAIERVNKLKPCKFNFIADPEKIVDGFLAHEVQEVVPEAISGEKDAKNEDGDPEYQSIDQSKLVPLLTAAIQEQQQIIDDLKSRIENLEK